MRVFFKNPRQIKNLSQSERILVIVCFLSVVYFILKFPIIRVINYSVKLQICKVLVL